MSSDERLVRDRVSGVVRPARPRGRKAGPGGPRSRRVYVLVTREEGEAWEAMAAAEGVSVSEWVRRRVETRGRGAVAGRGLPRGDCGLRCGGECGGRCTVCAGGSDE
jgi:hypothetical protein